MCKMYHQSFGRISYTVYKKSVKIYLLFSQSVKENLQITSSMFYTPTFST